MGWQIPEGYSAPDLAAIKVSMQSLNTPDVNGTYFAMKPIVFEGKTPVLGDNWDSETTSSAPLTPGEARTAFDNRWIHDDLVSTVEAIALHDDLEWRAPS